MPKVEQAPPPNETQGEKPQVLMLKQKVPTHRYSSRTCYHRRRCMAVLAFVVKTWNLAAAAAAGEAEEAAVGVHFPWRSSGDPV